MSMIKLDRYDKDAVRLVEEDKIVAMALRLANGAWGAFDSSETRLTPANFADPAAVRDWFAASRPE